MKCQKCRGEGKVADTDDQEPWSYWANLPVQSAIAVIAGIVKPIDCPRCGGTGEEPESSGHELAKMRSLLADVFEHGIVQSCWYRATQDQLSRATVWHCCEWSEWVKEVAGLLGREGELVELVSSGENNSGESDADS